MNIQPVYSNKSPLLNCLFRKSKWMALGTLFCAIGFNTAMAGQSVTGKIIIDGVIYGEGSSEMIKGSGVLRREQRRVDDFQGVKIKGGVDVYFKRADDISVELSGDDNLLQLIRTDVGNGVLTISSTKSYQTKLPLTVNLTGPQLSSLEMHGAGDITLTGLNEKALSLDLNGSGDVKAEGSAKQLTVLLNGSSNVDAKRLNSDDTEIKILGSGDIVVNAKQSLDVTIIGSGDVTYFGNPGKIDKKIIGSGDVEAGD